MNQIELKKLWDKLQTQPKDYGTFEEFKSKMSTPEMRKRFFDKFFNELKSNNVNLGSYDEYEKRLATIPTPTVTQPKKDSNDINTTANPKGVISITGLGKYKQMYFFNNGRYLDIDGGVKSYTCETISTEQGLSYKLNLQGKVGTATGTTTGSTTTKSGTTVNKKVSQYRNCNSFPFKKWCRSSKIKEIQKWIGFPMKYQTGNFGPITERGLKDLKIDISGGITLDIYNQIKTEHSAIKQPDIQEPQLYPNNTDNVANDDISWTR